MSGHDGEEAHCFLQVTGLTEWPTPMIYPKVMKNKYLSIIKGTGLLGLHFLQSNFVHFLPVWDIMVDLCCGTQVEPFREEGLVLSSSWECCGILPSKPAHFGVCIC